MNFSKDVVKKICFIIAFAMVLLLIVLQFSGFLNGIDKVIKAFAPITMGCILAFILNIPMSAFENLFNKKVFKKKTVWARVIGFLLTLIALALILFIFFGSVIPSMIDSVTGLIPLIRDFFDRLNTFILENIDSPAIAKIINIIEANIDKINSQITEVVNNGLNFLLNHIVVLGSSLVSFIVNGFLAIVFAIYILFGKEKLKTISISFIVAFVKKQRRDKIYDVLSLSNTTCKNFIVGQCTEAVILGLMFYLSLLLFRMPYPLTISVVIAIMSVIPYVGAFIGCAFGAFLILIINPTQALIFIVWFLIVQQLEGNLIYPKVVGNQVGLPAILVLGAVTVGGALGGVGGIMFGIPIIAVIYSITKTYAIDKAKKEEEKEKDEKGQE